MNITVIQIGNTNVLVILVSVAIKTNKTYWKSNYTSLLPFSQMWPIELDLPPGFYKQDQMTDVTSGTVTDYPSKEPEITRGFCLGSGCSVFNFLCYVLYIVVVLFRLRVVSLSLTYNAFECHFDILCLSSAVFFYSWS